MTNTYKIIVQDRNYSSWIINDVYTLKETSISIDPIENKLFNNDIFNYISVTNNINIINSDIRNVNYLIPCVLILKNNKTYGKTNDKYMYKCIPDDKQLPIFLVPYEIKHVGFSKIFNNLYVIITFVNWNNKHPQGLITHTIGEIDNLHNFYEYKLYCKKLNISIKNFTKNATNIIKQNNNDLIFKKYEKLEHRTNVNKWFIFTIDPYNTIDFDDAFSIIQLDNGITQLSIYISNVSILLDTLKLWESFSNRISTIYLPNKKIPMIPTILSDNLCSLNTTANKITFVMDLFIENNSIIKITYSNCIIKVSKNYVYEESELLNNYYYKQLFKTTQILLNDNIFNSHDIVSYLMIFMNHKCASEMIKHNNGIFRTTTRTNIPTNINKYGDLFGEYINCENINTTTLYHEPLNVDAYIHITSPIRRLVDLLNMIQFQKNHNIILSDNAYKFYNNWINKLDCINTTMRSIRKIQNECSLLNMCVNIPETIDKIYFGYILEKINYRNNTYKFIIYLHEIKLYSKIIITDNLEIYSKHEFKLYLFNDEETLNKKIRLQLIN